MNEHPAVREAYVARDTIVLIVTFAVLFLLSSAYFIIVYTTSEEIKQEATALGVVGGYIGALIGGGMLFVALLLLGMFLVRMMRQQLLGNCLQIEYSDYAWLRDWANQVAAELRMPQVEILVTQDPYMNAYAFGFINPYNIVLHSGSIRYLTHEELKVLVVHEMAHIKYGHTNAQVYLQPFASIPIVGIATSWIIGFWSRRAELAADRLALMYTRNPKLVKMTLAKIHIGPDAAKYLNQVAEQWLHYKTDRPMNRFAQTFSTHPFLVRRLGQIDGLAYRVIPQVMPAKLPTMQQAAAESDAQPPKSAQ